MRKAESRGQKSEVRGRRSEVRGKRRKKEEDKSEVRGRMTEGRWQSAILTADKKSEGSPPQRSADKRTEDGKDEKVRR